MSTFKSFISLNKPCPPINSCSSIHPSSSSDVEKTEFFDLNLENIQKDTELKTLPPSPCFILNSVPCVSIHDEIRDFKSALTKILPKKIRSPYKFLDIQILKDEFHAAAVTDSGIFVLLNLYNSNFSEIPLTPDPLSYVLVCKNDTVAIVKCRDKPTLFKIDITSMKVTQIVTYGVAGIGKLALLGESIFARVWEGKLFKISLENLQIFSDIFPHKKMISMNASPAGYILIGTSNKLVLKLDIFGKVIKEKQFPFRIDAYIYFSITGEQVFLAFPDSIKILNQELEILKEIYTGIQSYSLQLTVDEQYLIAGLQTGELVFFSMSSSKSLKIAIHRSSITSVFTTKDMSILYTFGTDSKLAVVYYPRLTLFKSAIEINLPFNTLLMSEFDHNPEEHFKLLCMAVSDRKDLVIVAGESENIAVWDRNIMKKCGDLKGHKGNVCSLACLSDSIAASGGSDWKVILWNFRLLRKESVLLAHSSTVSAVVKVDSLRLASGSWDRSVIIWYWATQEKIFTLRDFPEKIVALCTPKNDKILVGMPGFFSCWDLLTYCEMFCNKADRKIDCFRVLEVAGSVFIGLGMDEDSLWLEDPFNTKNVEVWGDETRVYEFFYYINGVVYNETTEHKEAMDKFTVFPYRLNALHFYAYFNKPTHLAQAILNGGALVNSVCGANPLSISIEMGHRECIEAILSAAWEKRSDNPFILSVASVSTLVELHFIRCNFMSKAYKMLLVGSNSQVSLNRKKNKLPFVSCYKAYEKFNKIENKKKERLKVSRTCISVYLLPGSEKSIKYLKSLTFCDPRVFKTNFIELLLLVKFEKIKKLLYFELFLFFIYFFCLVLACMKNSSTTLTVLGFVLGCVFLVYELGTMGVRSYPGVLWISQGSLLLICLIIGKSLLLSKLVIVLGALHGINYFQLFEKTSEVINFIRDKSTRAPMIFLSLLYFILVYCTLANKKSFLSDSRFFIKDLFYFSIFLLIPCFLYSISNRGRTGSFKNQYLLKTILKIETAMVWNRKDLEKEFIRVLEEPKITQVSGFKKLKRVLKSFSNQGLERSGDHRYSIKASLASIQQIGYGLKHLGFYS